MKKVRGTQHIRPSEIEVDVDTVYIRSEIVKINVENFNGWEYTEQQFKKDDYIKHISEENKETRDALAELTMFIAMGGI